MNDLKRSYSWTDTKFDLFRSMSSSSWWQDSTGSYLKRQMFEGQKGDFLGKLNWDFNLNELVKRCGGGGWWRGKTWPGGGAEEGDTGGGLCRS